MNPALNAMQPAAPVAADPAAPAAGVDPAAVPPAGADPMAAVMGMGATVMDPSEPLMNLVKDLLGQQEKPKGGGPAMAFLQSKGSFTVAPLEKSVAKTKQDDTDYWTALGYDA
jgi:hypothetical protein